MPLELKRYWISKGLSIDEVEIEIEDEYEDEDEDEIENILIYV